MKINTQGKGKKCERKRTERNTDVLARVRGVLIGMITQKGKEKERQTTPAQK